MFSALPVWRRSPYFNPKPVLFCVFDRTSRTSVKAQIRYLELTISYFPSKSLFNEIHLWGDVSPDVLWGLLEAIDLAGFQTVDVDSWRIFSAPHGAGADDKCTKLIALESLTLRYPVLSRSEWSVLLGRLVVPHLRKLVIEGDVSFWSLWDFLLQHPGIKEMCLKSSVVHLLPPPGIYHGMYLPTLQVIAGTWTFVLALLQNVPTPPRLRALSIEPICDLPYRTFVDRVIQCLTLCEGTFHLDVGFHPAEASSKLISSVNYRAILIQRLRKIAIRACIDSLCVRVQNISDENILVGHFPYTG